MRHSTHNPFMTGLRSCPGATLAFVLFAAASPTNAAEDIWTQMDEILEQLVKPANVLSNEAGALIQSDPAKACEMAKTSTAMMHQAQVRAEALNPVEPSEVQAVQHMRNRFKEIVPVWDGAEKMVCSHVPAA